MIDTLRRLLLATTLLTLGASGCAAELGGGADVFATDAAADAKDTAAVIVGSVDWVGVQTLPEGTAARENARPIAYLALGGSRCTGFLIAPDVLMTNHHCVPTAEAAAGATAYFRYEDGVTDDVGVDCSTFIGNDAGLDFALLQCAGRPGDRLGTVGLEPQNARVGDRVYAIHQNCDYYTTPSCAPTKKYSAGAIRQLGEQLGHDADTLGGSSGSPVFSDASHTVIALHRAGRSTGPDGRGTMNFAVPMTRILPILASRYPGLSLGTRAPSTPAAPGSSTSDTYEPNDTRGGATAAARPFASAGARIEVGDVDHFVVADGAALDVTLRFSHGAGDLDLAVVDAAGRQLAKSTGVADVERIQGTFAGPVVVVVYGYDGASGAYDLTVR